MRLQTIRGQRQAVVDAYKVSSYVGLGGSMRPNANHRMPRDPWIINLRKDSFLKKLQHLNDPTVETRSVAGYLPNNSNTFFPFAGAKLYYHGGTTKQPSDRIPTPPENKQFIELWAVDLGYFFFGVMLLTSIGMLLWMCFHFNHPVVRASQPPLMTQISIGAIISSFAILFGGMDDRYYSFGTLHVACNMVMWSYGLGFALTFTALLTKIWYAKTALLDAYKTLKAVKIPPITLIGLCAAGICIEGLILGIWTGTSGLEWKRVCYDTDRLGSCVRSRGYCYTDNPWGIIAPIAIYHLIFMLAALYLCYLARLLPETFAEIRWITTSMVSNIQIFLIGFFLLYNFQEQPNNYYLTKTFCIILGDGSVILFLYLPRMFDVYSKSNSADDKTKKELDKLAAKVIARTSVMRSKKSKSSQEKKRRGSRVFKRDITSRDSGVSKDLVEMKDLKNMKIMETHMVATTEHPTLRKKKNVDIHQRKSFDISNSDVLTGLSSINVSDRNSALIRTPRDAKIQIQN
ncbi:hypothetical protein AAMO2058_001346600 [Amorphochlora amoebiformis]